MSRYTAWFDGKTVNEVLFCEELLNEIPLKCIDGTFYGLDGVVSDGIITGMIFDKLKDYVISGLAHKADNILKALKYQCRCNKFDARDDEIHLLNGVLKTNGTWIAEKQFCVNRLNIKYDPAIWNGVYYPEKFMSFLYDLLESEDVKTLQEYLGYCLIPSTKGQAMLFLIGNGGEGKSRIGVVLQEIFKSAMVSGNFQKVETDRFFRYNLQNKLLMLDDDMQMTALPTTGMIKNLVTAEIPVDVEAKGKQSEQANLYTRFLCFGNGSPKALYDKSDGFARRLLILTTKQKPKDRIDDPYLAEKFIAEKEKIFCWMYDGLRRLIDNKFRFTISEKTKKNIEEVMSDNCNIIDFLKDEAFINFGENFEASGVDLYCGYEIWCGRNALTALKKDTFIGWLHSNESKYNIRYDSNVIDNQRHRVRGFKGINMKYTLTSV